MEVFVFFRFSSLYAHFHKANKSDEQKFHHQPVADFP